MNILQQVQKNRMIAIVRGLEPEHMLKLAAALHKGGISMMEVTFSQDKPEQWMNTAKAIQAIAAKFKEEITVGAGTVLSLEQLNMAKTAGAQFIVSPNADTEIIRETKKLGLVSFPGALTPTEIMAAHKAGADAVKVFPAGNLGPGYIKAIRAPLSHIPLLAVGGVDADNCGAFLKAGCVGVGVGGSLVNKQWIEAGEFDKITELAKVFVQNLSR